MRSYDDIIDLPHHTSDSRPHMAMADRAAQFAPFSALSGYDDAIVETARRTDSRPLPGEDELAAMDAQFARILPKLGERPKIALSYFVPDPKKEGGQIVERVAALVKVDAAKRLLVFSDGLTVAMSDVLSLRPEE